MNRDADGEALAAALRFPPSKFADGELDALLANGLTARSAADILGLYDDSAVLQQAIGLRRLLGTDPHPYRYFVPPAPSAGTRPPVLSVPLIAAAARTGCTPNDLWHLADFAGADPAWHNQIVSVVVELASEGRLPAFDRLTDRANDPGLRHWAGCVRTASVLLSVGCTPTADHVLDWHRSGGDEGRIRDWMNAAPAGTEPDAWMDLAMPWVAAGLSPAEGVRRAGLPAGHPDLPSVQDLAVMAELAVLQ